MIPIRITPDVSFKEFVRDPLSASPELCVHGFMF